MKIGIKDVAKAADVSKSTVSNVLNGKENVSEETRQKVLRICQNINYYPNSAGRSLKMAHSKTILFNFSDFDRSFYLEIIEGIHDYVSSDDYDLLICTSKSCEKYMRNSMTDGGIILDINMSNETLLRIAGERYPIVVMDRILDHPNIKAIVANNRSSMLELVQTLVDRRYRKFAFLGGPEKTADNIERYGTFLEVLESNGISFSKQNYFTGDYRERSGYKAAKIIMLAGEKPEVLVCANDNMAIGAIRAFREIGMRVPEDIAVTGFDDCELARSIGLTTVSIPNFERGYLAARHLIENINGKKSVEPLIINTSVVWRKTTR